MTEFEVEATCNMICKPGRKVRIEVQVGKEGNKTYTVKTYTVVKRYEHHVLMRCRNGYNESFSNIAIQEMVQKGAIKWR